MKTSYSRAIINFYETLENNKESFSEENWKQIEETKQELLKLGGNDWIGVIEEPEKGWGICLGGPNPDEEHYFEIPDKERAFEVKAKLENYFLRDK